LTVLATSVVQYGRQPRHPGVALPAETRVDLVWLDPQIATDAQLLALEDT